MVLKRSHFGPATIGAVIKALKSTPMEASCAFDFCYLSPTTVDSHRGHPDHPALGWTDKYEGDGHWPTVREVLTALEDSVGKRVQGWKGGYYTIAEDDPLWVDNPGHCSSTGVVDVVNEGDIAVTLITERFR